MSVIGDSALPRYEFKWSDGETRTTESVARNARDADGVDPFTAVESLADYGRDDPDCTVTMVGLEDPA